MGLKDRLRKLEEAAEAEGAVLVTDDGEEITYYGDFGELLVECHAAAREHRPVEHELRPYLERGLEAKYPERDGTIWGLMSYDAQQHLREPLEDLSE